MVTDFYGEWTDDGALLVGESHPAVEASVARTRAFVAGYAARAGASSEQLDEVRLAVSEAVTNVVEHAYRGRSGPIRLSVAVVPGELWVLVADEGCGRHVPSLHPGLGWGLRLIAGSCRELVLAAAAGHGTEGADVILHRRGPPGLKTGSRSGAAENPPGQYRSDEPRRQDSVASGVRPRAATIPLLRGRPRRSVVLATSGHSATTRCEP